MWFFNKARAAFLYGRALMRFKQKRFKDAVRLFETVCKLEPNDERKELTYSYLGRSYFALGQHHEALEIMSQAYELFLKRVQGIEDEIDKSEFKKFVKEYADALVKVGQDEHAREVLHEAEKFIS